MTSKHRIKLLVLYIAITLIALLSIPSVMYVLSQGNSIKISPSYNQKTTPGQTIIYEHTLNNNTSFTDTFSIKANSTQNWPVGLLGGEYSTGTVLLPLQVKAQTTRSFQISLSVPLTASGITEITVITATSQMSPTMIWDMVTDTTTVLNQIYLPLVLKRWPPIPYSPTLNPILNSDKDGFYTVSWSTTQLAQTYILQEDDNPSFSSPTEVYNGPETSWSTPNPGKNPSTYYYRVQGHNNWGSGDWSNIQSVYVAPPPPDIPGMAYIPASTFYMGCDDTNPDEFCYSDEQPLHTIYLDAYYIDKYEVTNAQYRLCVNDGDCTPPTEIASSTRPNYFNNPLYDDYPVINITWNDANKYCLWAGKRLPTEAEWEKAARSDVDIRIYPWGNEAPNCSRANKLRSWIFGNPPQYCVGDTDKVDSLPAGMSYYETMNMSGNVSEWVADWYQQDYYRESPTSNPTGPSMGTKKVLRGGNWASSSPHVRVAIRSSLSPSSTSNTVGFRCATSP